MSRCSRRWRAASRSRSRGAQCALTTRVPARKVAAIVGVVFAAIYVLLAGCGVPAVRTLLMLAVAAVGTHRRAPRHRRRDLALGARRRARPGIRGQGSRPASGCRSAPSASCSTREPAGSSSPPPSRARRASRCDAARRPAAPRPSSRWRSCPERSRSSSRCRSCRRSPTPSRSRSVTFAVVPLALSAIVVADRCAVAGRARGVRRADAAARCARGGAGGGMAAACAARLDGRRGARAASRCSSRRAACRDACSGSIALAAVVRRAARSRPSPARSG